MNNQLSIREFTLIVFLLLSGVSWAQVNISPGTTVSENFNSLGTTATATLPTGWKVDKQSTVRTLGNYTSAGGNTELRAGVNMGSSNGIYNFGAGDATSATDRAIGGISTGDNSKTVNIYLKLTNTGLSDISQLKISYNVEKYKDGSNAAGFSVQMYYSTDGSSWNSAGSDFLTSYAKDNTTTGYDIAPGATTAISDKTLSQSIAASGTLYLAWSYSVTTGTTTSNAQALGIDDVSITGIAAAATTPPVLTAPAAALSGAVGSSFSYTISATNSPTGYALASGTSLPAGLTLGANGIINGTPTQAGNSAAQVTATNGAGTSDPITLNFSIAKGTQSIQFTSLPIKAVTDADFALTATASSGLPVAYTSSNTAVATIEGATVKIVGVGTTQITASQAGNENYNAASDASQTLTVSASPVGTSTLAAWNFTGAGAYTDFTATTFSSALVSANDAGKITRGASAAQSSGSNSFRTTGFKNDGISVSNTDYFQITLRPVAGKKITVSSIDARLAGTSSFATSPGVQSQFAYSLDGVNFTLIGTPVTTTGTPAIISFPNLNETEALREIHANQTLTLRYYASGQTTSGGWGFNSPAAADNGLTINGSVADDINSLTAATSTTDVTISGNETIYSPATCKSITIAAGQTLTVAAGAELTVEGNVVNNGSLVLKSDSAHTASLIIKGNATGTMTFERFLKNKKWQLVASPLSGQSISSFLAGNDISSAVEDATIRAMADYNPATNDWNGYFTNSKTGNIIPGTGYTMRRRVAGTVSFTGTPQTGTVSVPVAANWNCIGNPYTSAIYLNNNANGILNRGNLHASNTALYIWDENQSATQYQIINNAGGADYIQAGQAFFLRMASAGSFVFTPDMQSNQPNHKFRSVSTSWRDINLVTTSPAGVYSTQIKLNADMTTGLDVSYDAGLLRSGSEFALYTRLQDDNGEDFALQCLPESISAPVAVGLDYPAGGKVKFEAITSNLEVGCEVWLEDRKAGNLTNLSVEGSKYEVVVSENTKGTGRFYLYVKPKNTTVDCLTNRSVSPNIYMAENRLCINETGNSPYLIDIQDAAGRNLKQFTITDGGASQTALSLPAGLYIVRLKEGNRLFIKKIIIR